MTDLDRTIHEAIKHLDAAEALVRKVKLSTTAVTVHWIDVARIHCHATLGDIRRESNEVL